MFTVVVTNFLEHLSLLILELCRIKTFQRLKKLHFIIFEEEYNTGIFADWIFLCVRKQETEVNIPWEFNEGWKPDRTVARLCQIISYMVLSISVSEEPLYTS